MRARWCCLLLFAVACGRPDPDIVRLTQELEAGERAGRKLAEIGPDKRDHLEPVYELMQGDDRRFIQITCLEALISAEAGEDALPAVAQAMKHRDGSVVSLAALAHWKITGAPDPGLAHLIEKAGATPPSRYTLELLARAAPIPIAIVEPLIQDDPLPPAKLAMVGAFGQSAAAAVPAVTALLDAEHSTTRIQAADTLYRITGSLQPAVVRLVREFRVDSLFLRQRIAATWMDMCTSNPKAMKKALRAMLHDGSSAVRGMAAVILGEIRARDSRADLERVFAEDPDPEVRASAERALHALGE